MFINKNHKKVHNFINLSVVLGIRQVKEKNYKNYLGLLWLGITPLIYSLIFVFIKTGMVKSGLKIDTGELHPGLFAFIGIALYQIFFETLLNQSEAYKNQHSFLGNNIVHPLVPTMASMVATMFPFLVRIFLIILFTLILSDISLGSIIGLLLVCTYVFLAGAAIGYILLPMGTLFQDVSTFLRSISIGLILASPVFYPAAKDPESPMYLLNFINPLSAPIDAARSLASNQQIYFYDAIFSWMFCLMICVILMYKLIQRVYPLLIERIIK